LVKDIKRRDIISALNSITEIAPHKEDKRRFVAKSANGYALIFESNEIVIVFKPTNKKSKSNLDSYFKKYAISDKKEIIKWKQKENLLTLLIKTLIGKYD
jgi:hypothetical protein